MLSNLISNTDDVVEITEFTEYVSEPSCTPKEPCNDDLNSERCRPKINQTMQYISNDAIILLGLAFFLLQEEKPDYLTVLSLLYILL